jgi:hypothetical protein
VPISNSSSPSLSVLQIVVKSRESFIGSWQAEQEVYRNQVVMDYLSLRQADVKQKLLGEPAGTTSSNQFQWLEQIVISLESLGQPKKRT